MYENLTQQLCGQITFMANQVNNVPEPDRSTILQRMVATFNKQLNQDYKQFEFVEVIKDDKDCNPEAV